MDTTNMVGSTLAPLGLSGTPKPKLQVTTTEADNGFILAWWDKGENRTHLCLTLKEVGQKFSELFGK